MVARIALPISSVVTLRYDWDVATRLGLRQASPADARSSSGQGDANCATTRCRGSSPSRRYGEDSDEVTAVVVDVPQVSATGDPASSGRARNRCAAPSGARLTESPTRGRIDAGQHYGARCRLPSAPELRLRRGGVRAPPGRRSSAVVYPSPPSAAGVIAVVSLLDLVRGLSAAALTVHHCRRRSRTVRGSRRVIRTIVEVVYDTHAARSAPPARDCHGIWPAYPRGVLRGFFPSSWACDASGGGACWPSRPIEALRRHLRALERRRHLCRCRCLVRSESSSMVERYRSLSLDQLIAAKRAANRPKDREHLIELEALRELSAGS